MEENEVLVFGGAFNPPGTHHLDAVEEYARHFLSVIVYPSGSGRRDKDTAAIVSDKQRATLCELTFARIGAALKLDLSDLTLGEFTPTWKLIDKFSGEGEVWLGIGSDIIAGGGKGQSVIQREWANGPWLWENGRFAVLKRAGYDPCDLPPRHRVFSFSASGASRDMRQRIASGDLSGLTDEAADYVRRHKLYGYQTGAKATA